MKIKPLIGIVFFLGTLFYGLEPVASFAAPVSETSSAPNATLLTIATMCEGVGEKMPVNPTIVFPVGNKSVYCLSAFDPVKEKSHINHYWYRRDKLVSNVRLLIQPPRWTTFSSIDLKESDKGPWRVDIVDGNNNLLKTLRFSITD